jgi:hypothetical protein
MDHRECPVQPVQSLTREEADREIQTHTVLVVCLVHRVRVWFPTVGALAD